MDVERIQKINNLALNLLNQGLASNREDAFKQAEGIFHGKGTEEYAEIKDRMHEVKTASENQNNHQKDEISKDQIKYILEQNTNFLVKTIKEFREKMVSMERTIDSLKEQVKTSPVVREIVTEIKRPVNGEAQPVSKVEEKSKTESHPRSGSYTDVDVSIEKYFYMGNK
ncbi:MAG: hypothetical protein ABIH82_01990 [Candidatus Woesearchaeota archaeon]